MTVLEKRLSNILKQYKDDSDLVAPWDIRKFIIELYRWNEPWLSNAFQVYLDYVKYKKIEITSSDLKDFIKGCSDNA